MLSRCFLPRRFAYYHAFCAAESPHKSGSSVAAVGTTSGDIERYSVNRAKPRSTCKVDTFADTYEALRDGLYGLEVRCSVLLSYGRWTVPQEPRAGEGNRTPIASLEGWSSTVELHPRAGLLLVVGARGFEPPTPCSQSRCATGLRHAPSEATGQYTRMRESPRKRLRGRQPLSLLRGNGSPAPRTLWGRRCTRRPGGPHPRDAWDV